MSEREGEVLFVLGRKSGGFVLRDRRRLGGENLLEEKTLGQRWPGGIVWVKKNQIYKGESVLHHKIVSHQVAVLKVEGRTHWRIRLWGACFQDGAGGVHASQKGKPIE